MTTPFIDHYLVLGLPTGEDGVRLDDLQIHEAYHAHYECSGVESSAAAAAMESSYLFLTDAKKRHDFNTLILNREAERKFARQKKRRQLASQKLQERIADRQKQPKQPPSARVTKRKTNLQETVTKNKRQAFVPTVDGISEAAAVMFATKKCWLKAKMTKTRILAEDQEKPQGELFQGWPQFSPPKTQLFQGWPQFNPPKPQGCGELFQGWPQFSPPPKTQGCGELFQGWPILNPRIA